MKKQYIKQPIPEAISEDGGASIVFVNKQTVPLDGAISEALAGNYCTGQKTLIRNFFFGLMQSMADGVRRDGHPRQLADFLTVYPVFKGEIDMDRGYDPAKNGVMIRARLLNEMDLDITDWSFEDVTPGKRSFTLTSCSTGEVIGVYRLGEIGHLNGKELPSTMMGEEIRVHWEVPGTDKSGDIPASKLTSETDRADIAADALAELASAEYDGKTIVFTVRGNFSSAKISAKLKYVVPPLKRASFGTVTCDAGGTVEFSGGENLDALAGFEDQDYRYKYDVKAKVNGGEPVDLTLLGDTDGETGSGTLLEVGELHAGDTVEIFDTVSPARTDVEQGTVTATATVA